MSWINTLVFVLRTLIGPWKLLVKPKLILSLFKKDNYNYGDIQVVYK